MASVAVAQIRFFLCEIKDLPALTEDQVVGLLAGFFGGGDLGVGAQGAAHRVEAFEQIAPGLLPSIGDAAGDDAFDLEPVRIGIAAGGKRLELRPQKTFFGEASLRLR